VFFREWTVAKARELGVTGWVRNLCDGRVEVYAIGDKSMLDQFAMHLNKGSPAPIVERIQSEAADVEAINGFTRRQTG
jgi:acylphosphatase